MKIELRYFTGTGNSLKILDTCKEIFLENKHKANISEISPDEWEIPESDIVGFCFPVYAFGIPRICRKYLKSIRKFIKQQKVFVVITAGDSDESGFSIQECEHILKKKNCEIIYSEVIQMPINWITSPIPPFPPPKEEALEIIEKGLLQAKIVVRDILNGKNKQHRFNYPKKYNKFRFHKDYWMFKYMGIQNLWRTFKIYDTCNGCQLCYRICPTNSIKIVENKPKWTSGCEQCMRCANLCPKEAIYQSMGGDTKGRNRYIEPSFKIKK